MCNGRYKSFMNDLYSRTGGLAEAVPYAAAARGNLRDELVGSILEPCALCCSLGKSSSGPCFACFPGRLLLVLWLVLLLLLLRLDRRGIFGTVSATLLLLVLVDSVGSAVSRGD